VLKKEKAETPVGTCCSFFLLKITIPYPIIKEQQFA
jgi:hypothetical protein